jgi:hypothetical protein
MSKSSHKKVVKWGFMAQKYGRKESFLSGGETFPRALYVQLYCQEHSGSNETRIIS